MLDQLLCIPLSASLKSLTDKIYWFCQRTQTKQNKAKSANTWNMGQ